MPKVVMRTWRTRRFQGSFVFTKSFTNTPQLFFFLHAWRIRLKNINELEEYARSILPYMKNTPIVIKLSLSQQINDKKNQILNHLPDTIE
jgi:hypothetical protein